MTHSNTLRTHVPFSMLIILFHCRSGPYTLTSQSYQVILVYSHANDYFEIPPPFKGDVFLCQLCTTKRAACTNQILADSRRPARRDSFVHSRNGAIKLALGATVGGSPLAALEPVRSRSRYGQSGLFAKQTVI